jgi:spermidine synthase
MLGTRAIWKSKPIKSSILKSSADRHILALVVTTGIASVAAQLVFVREYLAQFQGNEIVIALVFFNWLILGGIGTWLAHRPRRFSVTVLIICSFTLVLLSVGQLAAIRVLRPLLFSLGASAGFYAIFAFTFFTMAPYAGLVGFVLPYSLFLLRTRSPDYPGVRIYMADNLGDICGGALFAFVLIFFLTPMQTLAAAHLPLAVAAAGIRSRRHWSGLLTGAAVVAAAWGATAVETTLLRPSVGRLVHYEESRYGRLTVHKDQEQVTLFADGLPVYTTQDSTLAEETAHYPLSQVRRPDRILLISSTAGLMDEVLKHKPRVVDYVELDAAVSRLLVQYGVMRVPAGVHQVHGDARTWLRETDRIYDAILVALPEPDTLQLNRFYTSGFFAVVRSHLSQRGIFSFSVEGYDNFMTAAQRTEVSSLKNTAQRYFEHVQLLPGQRIYFLCRQRPLDLDIPGLLDRQGVATRYVGPYFHGNLTPERLAGLAAELLPDVPANTDTRPYLMRLMFARWFTKFNTSPRFFAVALIVIFGGYLLRLRREAFVLFTTGLVNMGAEIWVIFAFQIFLGYIYFKIGIVVTVFLAGLLPGAWWGQRFISRSALFLMLSDGAIIAWIVGFMVAVQVVGDGLPQGFFYAGGFLISLFCGFQFPLALARAGRNNQAAAGIFAVDLVGAACGALVASTLLIPYLGLEGMAAALIGIKIISLTIMGGTYVLRPSTRLPDG